RPRGAAVPGARPGVAGRRAGGQLQGRAGRGPGLFRGCGAGQAMTRERGADMGPKKLGLIHTSATLVPVFEKLCRARLPGADVFNIADDSLIKDVIARGELTARTARRVAGHVASAEEAGADFILVTCSSIGAAVEAAAPLTGVPVMRVDQPMADKAVQAGKKIGVLATLQTTLAPTAGFVPRRAAAGAKQNELVTQRWDRAFA